MTEQIEQQLINPQAEQQAIGAMLLEPWRVREVENWLKPAHFAHGQHRQIYGAILDLHHKAQPVDAITVGEQMKRNGERVDPVMFFGFIENTPTAMYLEHYAGIVVQMAERRQLAEAGRKTVMLAYNMEIEPLAARDQSMTMVGSAVHNHGDDGWVSLADATGQALDSLDETTAVPPIPTGFVKLDEALGGGLKRKRSYCIAGRPAMGKSAFAGQIALNMAEAGYRVGFFSLEMAAEDLAKRFISLRATVNGMKLQRAGMIEDEKEWQDVTNAAGDLFGLPLYINHVGQDTNMFSAMRSLHAKQGLDVLFVDYLQLVEVAGNNNRNEAIGSVSRRLKLAAMALDMAVVPLSQLNRAGEKESDQRPKLHHLRDSGAIEQDQDGVIGIYRDDYYNTKTANRNTAELIIMKHRFGPTMTVNMNFAAEYTKFF